MRLPWPAAAIITSAVRRLALAAAQQAENIALNQRIATLEARLASLELAMAIPQAAAPPLEANLGGGWPLVAGLTLAGLAWRRRLTNK